MCWYCQIFHKEIITSNIFIAISELTKKFYAPNIVPLDHRATSIYEEEPTLLVVREVQWEAGLLIPLTTEHTCSLQILKQTEGGKHFLTLNRRCPVCPAICISYQGAWYLFYRLCSVLKQCWLSRSQIHTEGQWEGHTVILVFWGFSHFGESFWRGLKKQLSKRPASSLGF